MKRKADESSGGADIAACFGAKPIPPNSKLASVVKCNVRAMWDLRNSSAVEYNPAPNPVSLSLESLATITPDEYVVAEKTDGTRYSLVLCTDPHDNEKPVAVLMDRACNKWTVPIRAPRYLFVECSLFDGEMVRRVSQPDKWDYYVFDAVYVGGRPQRNVPYNDRKDLIHRFFPQHVSSHHPNLTSQRDLLRRSTRCGPSFPVLIMRPTDSCLHPSRTAYPTTPIGDNSNGSHGIPSISLCA